VSEKGPPSSGRGVRPPALPVAPPPVPPPVPPANDADSTDEQFAMLEDTPDSHKDDMATMAKSPEESLALFGLGSGLTDAARAAVASKLGPGPAAGRPPGLGGAPQRPAPSPIGPPVIEAISPLTPEQETASLPGGPPRTTPLPRLHDRAEEEESTRAVSREEMLRGHDAVIIGEDGDYAQGEDATLAVAPGYNEANSQNLAALAETLTREQGNQGQQQAPPEQQGGFPPPYGQPAQRQHPSGQYSMDPSQQHQTQDPSQQQPWQGQQDPNAPQGQWQQNGPPSYPMGGAIGPVSGPHMPSAQGYPQSNPQFQVPQSSPQIPVGGQMQQGYAQGQAPIPYPGQSGVQQSPANPFGDWNAAAAVPPKKKFVLSGQILLLAIVGTVCLAIFITGIVLFATTKF